MILQAHGRLLEEYSTEGVATLPTPVIDSKPQLEASGAVPVVLRLGIRRKSFPLTAPRGNIPVVLVVGIGTEHCVSRPFEVAAKRNKGPTLKRKLPLLVVKSADIQSWEVEMSRVQTSVRFRVVCCRCCCPRAYSPACHQTYVHVLLFVSFLLAVSSSHGSAHVIQQP